MGYNYTSCHISSENLKDRNVGEIKERLKSPFHRRMYHDYWAEILNRIGYVAIARNYLRNPGLLEHFDYASIEHRIVGIVGARV